MECRCQSPGLKATTSAKLSGRENVRLHRVSSYRLAEFVLSCQGNHLQQHIANAAMEAHCIMSIPGACLCRYEGSPPYTTVMMVDSVGGRSGTGDVDVALGAVETCACVPGMQLPLHKNTRILELLAGNDYHSHTVADMIRTSAL